MKHYFVSIYKNYTNTNDIILIYLLIYMRTYTQEKNKCKNDIIPYDNFKYLNNNVLINNIIFDLN